MKKIMLQVSKEDWRKAKNYHRYKNLGKPGAKFRSEYCPIAQCLRRNGYKPEVFSFRAELNGMTHEMNAQAILIADAFDSKSKPLYGTVVFSR